MTTVVGCGGSWTRREMARAAGFTQISLSYQVSRLAKLVPRGDTTVVDAYLSPILRSTTGLAAAHRS